LAAKGDWAPIPQRCRTHPKEAEFIHRYAPSDTALHQILRFPAFDLDVDCNTRECLEKTKEDAVESLIDTYRPIASITDSFGRTPLHLACMDIQSCGETSFYRILDAWPKAAAHQEMTDLVKETPVDLVEARRSEIQNADAVLKQLKFGSDVPALSTDAGVAPIT
jgi:hypothetical protein